MRWIVTDDVFRETWSRILEYANTDLAIDAISRLHGSPKKDQISNYRKQAQQVRVALLQAKEYFQAAVDSSLVTSPNHLYYGSAALATAVMLIRGDGSKSLDMLRRDNANANHGLRFSTGASAHEAGLNMNLLEKTHVQILASGFFRNWYSTLPDREPVYARLKIIEEGVTRRRQEVVGEQEFDSFALIVGAKHSLIAQVARLPDLAADLSHYGVDTNFSFFDLQVTQPRSRKSEYKWLIHGAVGSLGLDGVLENFRVSSRFVDRLRCFTARGGAIVSLDYEYEDGFGFSWPSSRESLDNQLVMYAAELRTPEISDAFQVSFQLSMLARYFPDLWIACLESQCRGAKIIERVVYTLVRKMPLLALTLLAGEKTVVSIHGRP